MPADITENVLEDNICKALSLTGVNVVHNDLHAYCQIIVKFRCYELKNSIMYKRKNLRNKSQKLTNLKFSGKN